MFKTYYHSEIGIIEIAGTETGIETILFVEKADVNNSLSVPTVLEECRQQIEEYFQAGRREFSVKLLPKGTDFQLQVWEKLREIPFGQTWSYRQLAIAIGNEKAVRAVGNANSKNKLNIIVPCHRVIGSNGTLTGYAGGLWRKKWLLKHEGCRFKDET